MDVELDNDEWAGSNWFGNNKFWLFWFPIPLVDGVVVLVGVVNVVGRVVLWWWLSNSGWWWEGTICSDEFADGIVTVWSLLLVDRYFRLPLATLTAVLLILLNISLELWGISPACIREISVW